MSTPANSTNTTAAPLFFGVTSFETKFQCASYFVCGFVAIIANVAMAIGILKSKKERTRFNIIIVFLLISRMLMGLMLLIFSVYKSMVFYELTSFPTRLQCAVITLALIPTTLELIFLLFLAIDRAVALFMPVRYHSSTWRRAARDSFVVLTLVVVIKVFMIYGDPPLSTVVNCMAASQAAPKYLESFYSQFNFALTILLLAAYVLIFIGLKIKLQRLRSSNNQAILATLNRHALVMPTVRNIILVHCAFTLSSKLSSVLATSAMFRTISNELLLVSGMFISLELIVNVIVLLHTNEDIRKMTRDLFSKRKVTPTGNSRTGL